MGCGDEARRGRTRALVVAIAGGVPASVAQFRTAGYATVGDRGGASFRRVAAEPAHPGKLRDAIGAWFEQIDFVARPEQFGGFPSSDDCTVQVQAAWDYAAAKVMGGDVEFGPFTYKVGNVQARSGVKAYGAGMLRTKLERPTIGASGPYALQPVTIEQLPWSDVVRRYDGADALFYLDPPYDETEGYGVEFGRADYVAMAEQLAQIRGRFVLSINATPFVRETFARFDIAEVETTWTVSSASAGRGTKVTELIIRN